MPLFRVDIKGSFDRNLGARYVRAVSAQAALEIIKDWLGSEFDRISYTVTRD